MGKWTNSSIFQPCLKRIQECERDGGESVVCRVVPMAMKGETVGGSDKGGG
jgi:hypothetical protein